MAGTVQERRRTISVGNEEIDKKLGGGIPVGSLILVEGQSDLGKSVLVQQMIQGSLQGNFRVSLFTTEDSVKSFIRQMQSLDKDILDDLLLGRLKIYPVKPTRAAEGSASSLAALLTGLNTKKPDDLTVIDSLTGFIAHTSPEKIMSFFEDRRSLCRDGMTIAVVAHSYAFGSEMLVRISSMCDAHLRLSLENVGERLLKILEVAKIRGAEKTTGNIITFDIEPGWGMKIIHVSKARA